MFGVFVAGEPVLSGGKGQDEWQEAIRRSVVGQPTHPSLTFVVSSLRRRGHPFDLDNLIHPVLMVFEGRAYVYSATRSREQAGASALWKFVDGVFRGDPLLLFEHLIDGDRLDDAELTALRKMIDDKRKERQ